MCLERSEQLSNNHKISAAEAEPVHVIQRWLPQEAGILLTRWPEPLINTDGGWAFLNNSGEKDSWKGDAAKKQSFSRFNMFIAHVKEPVKIVCLLDAEIPHFW